jgi:hypothetical protein
MGVFVCTATSAVIHKAFFHCLGTHRTPCLIFAAKKLNFRRHARALVPLTRSRPAPEQSSALPPPHLLNPTAARDGENAGAAATTMSDLHKDFLKARLRHLPQEPPMPPPTHLSILSEEANADEEVDTNEDEDGDGTHMRPPPSPLTDDSSSASSASSTSTIKPLFPRALQSVPDQHQPPQRPR